MKGRWERKINKKKQQSRRRGQGVLWGEKRVLRNFAKFTGKKLCLSLFFNKIENLRPATLLKKRPWPEATTSVLCNKVFLEILQNSKRDSVTVVFLWILQNFEEDLFYRTPLDDCFSLTQVFFACEFFEKFLRTPFFAVEHL